MSDIDFFVHPEFAFMSLTKELRDKYLKAIIDTARKSENPILVNPLIRNKGTIYDKHIQKMSFFDKLIPDISKHIYSNSIET